MYKSKLVFKSPSKENYFFGYFNKKQLNADNNKILALRVKKLIQFYHLMIMLMLVTLILTMGFLM